MKPWFTWLVTNVVKKSCFKCFFGISTLECLRPRFARQWALQRLLKSNIISQLAEDEVK